MSLQRFIIKRILLSVPVLIGVSIVTFGLIHLTPGDPVDILLQGQFNTRPGQEQQLRRELGLHLPVYEQYLRWITDLLQGDLGETYVLGPDVATLFRSRLPETIALGLFGWAFALLIAIPGGIIAAVWKGDWIDDMSRFLALSGISIPNFWLGLMLLGLFGVQLGWFPVLSPQKRLFQPEMLWWLLLPGITIGTAASANLMRIMRTSMVEELNKEYVTAARAKGLPEWKVILKHVLRNSLISVTTVAAFLTASIVSGSVVVEVVFGWPGLGQTFVEAVQARDINFIMAFTLFTGVFIVLANLLADIVYAILDPRIRDEY